jgi:hypothetical protein
MKYAFAAALLAVTLAALGPSAALAAADDYAFEATTAKVSANREAVVAVRLVNRSTGKPVPNAVIFQTRLDMSPDSMGEMTGAVTPLPATEPGVYRFRVNVGMAGRWALKMAAKVPGEQDTVRGDVIVTATQ